MAVRWVPYAMFMMLSAVQAFAQAPAAQAPPQQVSILLVGDSTVTDHAGWGKGFAALLRETANCKNAALGGRSSRSFRGEGHWDKALKRPSDYILIQFGHNDQPGKGPERESDPETDFRAHLRRYVTEARQAGMRPVLVTSLTRRRWNKEGKIDSNLKEYAAATGAVAQEMDVPLLDLHKLSIEQCNRLGPEKFRSFEPTTNGGVDHTHLNAEGSRAVGRIVATELVRLLPELKPHLKLEGP